MGSGNELRHQIRAAREARGLSQAELAARVGTSQQTIDKIERGEVVHSRYLSRIREQLAIEENPTHHVPEAIPAAVPLVGVRDLPVFGSVEGGGGAVIVSSEPVDFVRRPAPLAQVKDGYAILVSGESMVPAFEPGDTVLVHPHLPPVRDCDVVLYGRDRDDNEVVTIKRLVRSSTKEWYLRQWNPPAGGKPEFTLPRKDWPKCHRIVGKYSRR
jgi:phage repressor protein C with HTH and peptisase S24 domain